MTTTPIRVPLQQWFRSVYNLDADPYADGPAWHQIMFVRDRLVRVVAFGLDHEDVESVAWVISTHGSKGFPLPVYQLERPDLGLRFVLRNNFHDWKLSVISELPIDGVDFAGLFRTTPPIDPAYTGDPLDSVYFEGFPEGMTFGYYETSDKRRWSAEIQSNEAMWTTLFLIMRARGAIGPLTWHTEASHRVALDAEAARRAARRAK